MRGEREENRSGLGGLGIPWHLMNSDEEWRKTKIKVGVQAQTGVTTPTPLLQISKRPLRLGGRAAGVHMPISSTRSKATLDFDPFLRSGLASAMSSGVLQCTLGLSCATHRARQMSPSKLLVSRVSAASRRAAQLGSWVLMYATKQGSQSTRPHTGAQKYASIVESPPRKKITKKSGQA